MKLMVLLLTLIGITSISIIISLPTYARVYNSVIQNHSQTQNEVISGRQVVRIAAEDSKQLIHGMFADDPSLIFKKKHHKIHMPADTIKDRRKVKISTINTSRD